MPIVVSFGPDAPAETAARVLELLDIPSPEDRRCRWHDSGLLVVRSDSGPLDRVRQVAGVARAVALPDKHPLVSAEERSGVVTLPNGARIGGGAPVVIAGPCSAESESQVCEIARIVKEAGAVALRGGAFKPRTSPYAFGGLGEKGLEFLARAREKTGLPVVTEALDTSHVDVVARYADMIQIGSRNMSNYPLLFKAGSHPSGKPILLKRGFAATIEELLMAAEYVLLGRMRAGIDEPRLILCERGIRTFDDSLRFTLDVGAFPVLKERTRLPVLADPSHAAGARRHVPPLAMAALAAGADGLLVEVHVDPDRAWSDAEQSLDPEGFRKMMEAVRGR
ncbi:MAG: 3-deoxy-7-phosphoheptulonate synthase [Planctomycetes bacterium]|nr:3-deoxy-7-phosphoheptulonate synthase [Planctomycetota bacterium]